MASRTLEIIVNQSGNAKAGVDSLNASLGKTTPITTQASGGLKGMVSSMGLIPGPAGIVAAGIAAIGTATMASVNAAREGRAAQAQLAAVLTSTAHAAGINQAELNKHAEALQKVTNYDDEAVAGAQALLLTFTKIGGDIMPDATKTVLNMSTALGQDLKSSSIQVGKALQDPINGVTALRRAGVNFTEDQQAVIASLVKSGDILGAQTVILKELETEFGGSAEAAREADGGFIALGNSLGNLAEAGGEFILMANDGTSAVGRLIEVVDGMTESVNQVAGAFNEGLIPGLAQIFDNANPVTQLLEKLGVDVIPDFVASSGEAATVTNELAGAHAAAATAAGEQQAVTAELAGIQAGYYNEASKLQDDFKEKEQDYLTERLEANQKSSQDIAQNEVEKNQKISELQTKANQDRLKAQQDGDNQRASEVDKRLQEDILKLNNHYLQEGQVIKKAGDDKLAELDRQFKEEEAKHREQMQKLLILTALRVAEQNGKLSELTGGLATTAEEAFALIDAGVLSYSGNIKREVDSTLTEISAKTGNFARTEAANNKGMEDSTASLIGSYGDYKTGATSVYDDVARASQRSTDSIITDFDKQARAAQIAYQSSGLGRGGSVNYSGGAGRTSVRWGPGMASGGSFKVPPGYPNDTFPIRVSSGEQVTVIPASEAGRGPGFATGTGIPKGWKLDETGLGYVPPDYVPGSTWNGSRWIPPPRIVVGNQGPINSRGFGQAQQRSAYATSARGYKGSFGSGFTSRAGMASSSSPSLASEASTPISRPTAPSGGGAGGDIHIHIDYHPAVSLADQRQLVDVLKQAVREINRLDKVVTA